MSSSSGSKRPKAGAPAAPKLRKSILHGAGRHAVNGSSPSSGSGASALIEGGGNGTARRSVTFIKITQDDGQDGEEMTARHMPVAGAKVVAQQINPKQFGSDAKRKAPTSVSAGDAGDVESAVSQAAAAGVKEAAAGAALGNSSSSSPGTRSNAGGLLMAGGDFLPNGLMGNMVSLAGEAGGSGMRAVRHARLIQQLIMASGDEASKAYEKWNRKRQGLSSHAKSQAVYESELAAMQNDVRKAAGKIRTRRRGNLLSRLQEENLLAGFSTDVQELSSQNKRLCQAAKGAAKTSSKDERAAADACDDKISDLDGSSSSSGSSDQLGSNSSEDSSDSDVGGQELPPGLTVRRMSSLGAAVAVGAFRKNSRAEPLAASERRTSVDGLRGLQKFLSVADAVRRGASELKQERPSANAGPSQQRRLSGLRRLSAEKIAKGNLRRPSRPSNPSIPAIPRRHSSGIEQARRPSTEKGSTTLVKSHSTPAGAYGQELGVAAGGSEHDVPGVPPETDDEEDSDHEDDDDDDDSESSEGEEDRLVLTAAQRLALPEVFGISKFRDQSLILGERWKEPASTFKRYHNEVADRLGLDAEKGEWDPSDIYSLTIPKLEILAQSKMERSRIEAAIFIQSRWRAFRTRWPVQQMLAKRQEALKKIQPWLKKVLKRKGIRMIFEDAARRIRAAIKVEKYTRTWLVKKHLATEMELHQVTYRMQHLSERLYPAEERERDREALEMKGMGEEEACTRAVEEYKRAQEEKVANALKLIQPTVRRFLLRKNYRRKVQLEQELKEQQDKLNKDRPWGRKKKRDDDDHEHRHGRQAQGKPHGRLDYQPRKGDAIGHSESTRRASFSSDHGGKALVAIEV
eukprot:TRINITY_DN8485_c0_g1_i2.p1 TRINITY_DN8485_c0_g1~~TRINITY_DN8485_c0_g1_i2.p1  ORF type:complete len:857 (-),score=200.55 TRINITY_DN8485_c0_g1_i2:97-2667(-)